MHCEKCDQIKSLWRFDTLEYIRKIGILNRTIDKLKTKVTYCFNCENEFGAANCDSCDENASNYRYYEGN